jgi:hypothetical protein
MRSMSSAQASSCVDFGNMFVCVKRWLQIKIEIWGYGDLSAHCITICLWITEVFSGPPEPQKKRWISASILSIQLICTDSRDQTFVKNGRRTVGGRTFSTFVKFWSIVGIHFLHDPALHFYPRIRIRGINKRGSNFTKRTPDGST